MDIPEQISLSIALQGSVATRSNKPIKVSTYEKTGKIYKTGDAIYHSPVLKYASATHVRKINEDIIEYWIDNPDPQWHSDSSPSFRKHKWNRLPINERIDTWCLNTATSVEGFKSYSWG
jgi:hypothetical protein